MEVCKGICQSVRKFYISARMGIVERFWRKYLYEAGRLVLLHLFLVVKTMLEPRQPRVEQIIPRRIPVFELIDMVTDLQALHTCSFKKYTDKRVTFPLKNSFFILTDVVNSTALYNKNPRAMRQMMELHDNIAVNLVKEYSGHVVGNEGDSFAIVFETIGNAIGFCKKFLNEIHRAELSFRVRVGINKGIMYVRNIYGYKCFGQPVDELTKLLGHNAGGRICIKKEHMVLYNVRPDKMYCVH